MTKKSFIKLVPQFHFFLRFITWACNTIKWFWMSPRVDPINIFTVVTWGVLLRDSLCLGPITLMAPIDQGTLTIGEVLVQLKPNLYFQQDKTYIFCVASIPGNGNYTLVTLTTDPYRLTLTKFICPSTTYQPNLTLHLGHFPLTSCLYQSRFSSFSQPNKLI
jgi:hypothetical protein